MRRRRPALRRARREPSGGREFEHVAGSEAVRRVDREVDPEVDPEVDRMKAVIQRVSRACVRVDGEVVGAIGPGMLVLVCALRGDTDAGARALAEKIARFRFFADPEGKMNLSALDRGLEVLVVSQFTLAADGDRGRRPSFDRAAPPDAARALVERFVETLRGLGLAVETGRFGAEMEVDLVNDGPVTFVLETPPIDPGS